MRTLVASISLALLAFSASAQTYDPVANAISAQSLKGHLSFLASDLLEGRGTPSRGQDIAAEYIAMQFRRAGLEPAGDEGYFQTSEWPYAQRDMSQFVFTVQAGGKTIVVPVNALDVRVREAVNLNSLPLVHMEWDAAMADASHADGQILVLALPKDMHKAYGDLTGKYKGKPAVLVLLNPNGRHASGSGNSWVVQEGGPRHPLDAARTLVVYDPAVVQALSTGGAVATLNVPAPTTSKVKLRNVVGVLRGSDPQLKNTYVMVTSHYDHLGIRNGDIYNGANDDGSGTVSVIEIASALAAQKDRPKRSMVFMTFFGEELGLLGSRYYGKHPLFPFKDTVADLNLEQVGRTDDSEAPNVRAVNVTGFDFSTVTDALVKAGQQVGVRVWKHEKNSDPYFAQSDNQSLADAGVPAHTLSVAYEYPDYHGKDDKWQKIDYDNMAKVDRVVALALRNIANDRVAPTWKTVPNAAKYLEAAKNLK
jgi:hypothetical protein